MGDRIRELCATLESNDPTGQYKCPHKPSCKDLAASSPVVSETGVIVPQPDYMGPWLGIPRTSPGAASVLTEEQPGQAHQDEIDSAKFKMETPRKGLIVEVSHPQDERGAAYEKDCQAQKYHIAHPTEFALGWSCGYEAALASRIRK